MKNYFYKSIMVTFLTLNLSSCWFDQTNLQSQASSSSSTGSADLSLYVKFSDVTTCTAGKVLKYNGTSFPCVLAGVQSQTDITTGGASYIISNAQDGILFTYNDTVDGTVSLPALSTVQNGFQVTMARQVAHKVLIQTNGADTFQNAKNSLEMRGNNISTLTIVAAQGKWQILHETADCRLGESCWGQNNIYLGTLNGHQYFTTPGNCTNSVTPVCDGQGDQLFKAWANNSGTSAYGVNTGALNTNDGKAQSAMLATTYTDTEAAQYCENMTYAGYSDWYLPAKMELALIYSNKANISGMSDDWSSLNPYWSSTEFGDSGGWILDVRYGNLTGSNTGKNFGAFVRCVRRF